MVNGRELSEALAETLSVIPGVRVHAYAPDSFQPPGIVVQRPTMTWETTLRTFENIGWEFPIAVAVSRTIDRDAQSELFRLVEAISDVLAEDSTLGGVVDFTRVINAAPGTISSQGIEYPSYVVTLNVIA